MLPRELGEPFCLIIFLEIWRLYLDLDIDFFLFLSIFGSFGFYYCLVLFLAGKKIREDVESRKPRSLHTRPDSIPFCSNFCIRQMDPLWNFFNLFNPWSPSRSWQFLLSFFLIASDWLLLLLSSVTFGFFFFFFSKREMIHCAIQQNELELLELKGIIVLLVYFLYLKY